MFEQASGRGGGGGRGQGGGRGRGQGPGRQGPFAAGPGGECVCPACGERVQHQAGKPCTSLTCPSCGAAMTRADTG